MLVADEAVELLDYFRVAYTVDEASLERSEDRPLRRLSWLEEDQTARALFWPTVLKAAPTGPHRIGNTMIFAAIATDDACLPWLRDVGGEWGPMLDVHDREGVRRASIWRDDHGNLFLPFDPDHAIELLLTERYRTAGRGVAAAARRSAAHLYYRVRPALPRRLQIAARRVFSRAQTRSSFPAWPTEPSLHDLYEFLLGLVAELAQRPVPYIAPWPAPYTWALVLTHDVETGDGYVHVDGLRRIEESLGLRSSWNFVSRRYDVEDRVVRELTLGGHEVGVHGLHHDGRDLESKAILEARLPEMEASARRWGAVGFRSPALRRSIDLMPLLPFDYDSSYPDTDPFGPDGGGCCSWLPYMIGGLVELPVTLPQDHTLFEILNRTDPGPWLEKTDQLRARGGMALVLTHPDYMLDSETLHVYETFLRTVAPDSSAWKALPRDVSAWWRRRSRSRLVFDDGRWRIEGEAAGEAAVAFVEPPGLS
jgi:peptidoglycan/xylan/chitin deacetylase (PgdA/CDA1 family)